jgi:hypothetical protein
MPRLLFWSWILLLLLTGVACQPTPLPPGEVHPGFYHWKGSLQVTPGEMQLADSLQARRLYLRLFDLDASPGQLPYPVGALTNPGAVPAFAEIVPTIFITNRSFQDLTLPQVATLANKTWEKIRRFSAQWPDSISVPEWQFDCDWTNSTQEAYFAFVQQLTDSLHLHGLKSSATIRLHQVKYADRTGIPPADRGMLMPYNMGDVKDPSTPNSILDLELLPAYLVGYDQYPLPLDVALPLFHWGVVFRDGEMVRLINQLDAEDLSDSLRFQKRAPNQFEVRQSTYLHGHYLYQGDRIRLEGVTPSQLVALAKMLSEKLGPTDRHVVFYHLDALLINQFQYDELDAALRAFQ